MDLSKVSTKESHEELAQREGVSEYVADAYKYCGIVINGEIVADESGPVRVLINRD